MPSILDREITAKADDAFGHQDFENALRRSKPVALDKLETLQNVPERWQKKGFNEKRDRKINMYRLRERIPLCER